MDILEVINRGWPIFLSFITLVIVLAKQDLRVGMLEEKVRTLFELLNKEKEK